jgi:hypothetical protein
MHVGTVGLPATVKTSWQCVFYWIRTRPNNLHCHSCTIQSTLAQDEISTSIEKAENCTKGESRTRAGRRNKQGSSQAKSFRVLLLNTLLSLFCAACRGSEIVKRNSHHLHNCIICICTRTSHLRFINCFYFVALSGCPRSHSGVVFFVSASRVMPWREADSGGASLISLALLWRSFY